MEFETIPARELDRLVQDDRIVVIDLRSPEEYRAKHIKGAVNLPYEEWKGTIPYSIWQEIVLYCERGAVSMAAARELADDGYRVKTVVGGIRAYRGTQLEGINVKKSR